MKIRTDVRALNAVNNVARSGIALQKSVEKLASGLRINRAGDDAGNLGISERMRAQIRSLAVNERNIQDAIGFLQTAEGAHAAISDMLQRMRELAVQAANGVLTTSDRQALDDEAAALSDEIDRIGQSTEFNGQNVFTLDPRIRIGPNAASTANNLTINLQAVTSTALPGRTATGNTTYNVSAAGVNLTTRAAARTEIGQFDTAISRFSAYRAQVGAILNRFESMLQTNQNLRENLAASESRIRDTDLAAEATKLARSQIVNQAANAMVTQANIRATAVRSLLAPLGPPEKGAQAP